MKQCWREKAVDRPTALQAARCLLTPIVQSFLGSVELPSSHSVRRAVYVKETEEVWFCCDGVDGTDVIIVDSTLMTVSRSFSIPQYQVRIK